MLSLPELINVIRTKPQCMLTVSQAMKQYNHQVHDWNRYYFLDPTKQYTRNIIQTDAQNYALMLLCWKPYASSEIHNHASSQCFMVPVSGLLKEQRYQLDANTSKPKLQKSTLLKEGECVFINDLLGVHKIINQSDDVAVSLHCYIPPIGVPRACNE